MRELVVILNPDEELNLDIPYSLGVVYIIENESGKVKIGRTINPKQRLRDIQTQGGSLLKKIAISIPCSNYCKLENKLHKHFKEKRHIGEWFDVEFEDVLSALKKLKFEFNIRNEEEDLKRFQAFAKSILESEYTDSYNPRKENLDYHCEYCYIPIECWTDDHKLSTYKGDSCKLYSMFSDIVEELEEKNELSLENVNICTENLFNEFNDVENPKETLNEMIEIIIDLGIVKDFRNNES